ncbi:MAG: EthD family reductase [Actinomycetota bacterium]|nr:EthD family reductase [Actinomycetota bacterium]
MVRLTVLYGHPEDTASFLDHYENTHAPLAQAIPDVVRFTWGKCLPGLAGEDPPYFLIAELEWDNADAMGAAMTSAEGGAAGADVANFATGGATMLVSEGH